jgi:chromosome segregation protein
MLKRLELVGFKSFADKTRFDFSPGITAIVGPNGSGKSNVVDAIRWILGEQSAKSLRGGEMADVIFNGSSSRKSFGMAEATVVFDNERHLLAVDAEEVQVSRRVYRDGTGEYLINGQMSRLKDIKEIFLGSGAGSGGYTIIAQGRVDELLQASTKDRRDIFDEAAGISRFKAKKIEALRKLDTVEQNLTRSRDRLEALDGQLRTLRLQAAKAQRYKEYSDRLKELRLELGVREYRELTAALEVEERGLTELKAEVDAVTGRTNAHEQKAKELDWEVNKSEDGLRHQEAKLADARQLIAGFEATMKHERVAAGEHEEELLRLGRERAELGQRVKALESESAQAAADAAGAGSELREVEAAADAAARELSEVTARTADFERQAKADRELQYDLVSRAAAARSLAGSTHTQVDRLQKEYSRKLGEIEHKTAQRGAQEASLDGLSRADADLQARLGAARNRLQELFEQRESLRVSQERVQQALEERRVRQGVLLGAGVREVLEQMAAPESHLSNIVGLVADLLTVPREAAPLVELALGDAAQRFVVRDRSTIDAIAAAIGTVSGRVGFIPLVEPGATARENSLAASIHCDRPELASLPAQLLGNVVLAESLEEARRLASALPAARFITRAGELLEPDGTLLVGPPTSESGLVSRKSELRELRIQLESLGREVGLAERELLGLRRQADSVDGVIDAVDAEIGLLSGEAGDLQQQIARQRQQIEQLDDLVAMLNAEVRLLEDEVRQGEARWLAAKHEAEETERRADAVKARLEQVQAAILAGEQDRERCQIAHTQSQVALSRAAAERDRTRDRLASIESDLRKRKIEVIDRGSAFSTARMRLEEGLLAMLRASAGTADAFLEKESRERAIGELAGKAAADRMARDAVREELRALRDGWQDKQNAAHARELAAHDLRARREAAAARIRDDYAIELAELASGGCEPPESDESEGLRPALAIPAAQQEIDELKRKLARLGNVNLEALEELARVEAEQGSLKAQHDDLAAARHSLQQVIDTINNDSRTMFTDTLAAVRGYFQELFRKLFAGGQADIILEEGVDVLESGIEITARPPGKELRTLSLLSGGEKTLTAIALLLAIFRNKPSPFCVLDEVDAALDEANTTRFAGVIREFLDRSQFIVVTHKKRTMACADRLWGVTMQESGVSRLLPMRFEDWPDEELTKEAG